jgi:two-component system phosphate regulon response regulator PhoB
VFCRSAARVPRHARRLRPAAVVLDAVLGRGLNGFQICAILKQEPATRGIPVLMTSGVLPAENSAREAARLGAAGFIKKAELWPALLRELDVLLRPSRAPDPGSALSSAETVRAGAVLIVDDQEEWLDLARRVLQEDGHRVFATADETHVVELAIRHRPECIVLDYQLRRSTAPDVCRRLQAREETRGIPVIVLTGNARSREECLELGADQFVAKGAPIGELPRAVAVSIRRYRWSAGILVKEDLRLDRRDRSVHQGGRPVARLADNRFEFLHALVRRSPEVVSRRELSILISPGGELVEGSKALDKLAARTKEDLGRPLADRIHQLKELGWVYELRLPGVSAK